MQKEMKNTQLIMRLTESEKEFLLQKAEEENRTLAAIVKIALMEKYAEYQKIKKNILGVKKDND